MGVTKTSSFSKRQNETAALFKALGHPARIAIIEFLLKKKECICNDIVNELSLAQPTISQHLKELKQAGIIQGEIEGNSVCYCINADAINKILNILSNYSEKVTINKCC